MRRLFALLMLLLLQVGTIGYGWIVRSPAEPRFAFLGPIAPSGVNATEATSARTSYVVPGRYDTFTKRARLELRSKGWREVPLREPSRLEFTKGRSSATLLAGRLLPDSLGQDKNGVPKGVHWLSEPGLVSIVVERVEPNPFRRWQHSVRRWL